MKRATLFAWTAALALSCSAAAQVFYRHEPPIAEISGPGWALRYRVYETVRFLECGQDRAFFVNGRSLRWIDTKQGVVLARWLLPEKIERLETPDPSMVRAGTVRIVMSSPFLRDPDLHEFLLDPANPQVPRLPPYPWSLEQAFASESTAVIPHNLASGKGDPKRLAETIARLQEMTRRDSLSPWLHFHLGKLLRGAGDARSRAEFQAAAECCRASSDFLEMFALSEAMQEEGEEAASETAFQSGLRDYRARGLDPRLFISTAPTFLYPVTWRNLPANQHALAQERMYQLGPWSGGGKMLFPLLATDAARHGRATEARMWQQRADEARAHSLAILEPMTTLWLDRPLRWAAAGILAAILYAVALFTKYFARGRDDIALRRSQEGPGGNFRFLRVEYWSWTERVNFLLIVALGWAALGISGAHYRAFWRFQVIPPQSRYGSFAGPDFARFLQKELPPTPERDLLLEISQRQSAPDGQPLALPTPAQMERAFLGGGPESLPLWALGGPLTASRWRGDYGIGGAIPKLLPGLYAALLPLALASFLMPQWPALPSRAGTLAGRLSPETRRNAGQWIRETLAPGVSARWSFLGGVFLLAWCQELVKILVIRGTGSLEIYAFNFRPGMENFWRVSFGYTGAFPQPPQPAEIYGAAVGIWLVNLLWIAGWRVVGTRKHTE
jgi:hypothetical protein